MFFPVNQHKTLFTNLPDDGTSPLVTDHHKVLANIGPSFFAFWVQIADQKGDNVTVLKWFAAGQFKKVQSNDGQGVLSITQLQLRTLEKPQRPFYFAMMLVPMWRKSFVESRAVQHLVAFSTAKAETPTRIKAKYQNNSIIKKKEGPGFQLFMSQVNKQIFGQPTQKPNQLHLCKHTFCRCEIKIQMY